jgi:hypothetical protein
MRLYAPARTRGRAQARTEANGAGVACWWPMRSDAVETVCWDDTLSAFVLESSDDPHDEGEPVPNENIVPAVSVEELEVDLYPIRAYR